jgi:GT2 family glycosyltransferase
MAVSVSVIVLVWNGAKFLDACLSASIAQDYEPRELIVVDNDSKDDSVAIAQKYLPSVKLVRNDYNLGFVGGNNIGIRAAQGEIMVLLNQDTVVQPGWLRAVVETFSDSSIGIVGCKMLYPISKKFQHAGGVVSSDDALTRHIGWDEEDNGQYDAMSEPEFVTGAAFAIHRKVLNKLGPFDEGFHPAFYEEIDYCYRARRAGFRIIYQPKAVLYHHETTSLPEDSYQRASAFHRNRVRFVLRHWDAEALKRFVNAESAAIESSLSLDDTIAHARAYWDNMLALSAIAMQRQHDDTLGGPLSRGNVQWLLDALQKLRTRSHQRIEALLTSSRIKPKIETAEPPAPVEIVGSKQKNHTPLPTNFSEILNLLNALEYKSELQDPVIRSRVPIFGALISGFQTFWFSLIIRHYLGLALNQQSSFNQQLRNAVAGLAMAAQEQGQSIVSRDDNLQSQLESLQAELQSQQTIAERQQHLIHQKTDTLLRLQEILSADQAAVPDAIMNLLDRIERVGKIRSDDDGRR